MGVGLFFTIVVVLAIGAMLLKGHSRSYRERKSWENRGRGWEEGRRKGGGS